jgi:hypothetical protein
MSQLYIFQSANVHAIPDRINSSTYSKYCVNIQANHHSHPVSSSMLVTLLKFIYVSNSFVCTVCFKLINCLSDITFTVHESSTSFTSYTVQITSINLPWILQPLQFNLLPLI